MVLLNIELAAALCAGAGAALIPLQRIMPRSREEVVEMLHRTGVKVVSENELTRLGLKLARAGLEMSPAQFAGLRIGLCAAFVFAVFPLILIGADFFWLVVFAPLLWYSPVYWLNSKISARKTAIRLSLENFSVFLSTALSAGADLSYALREAAANAGGPLAQEVDRALKEYGLGRDLTVALTDMAERCDVNELRYLVRTICQSYRYGAPLAETFRAQAERMRTERRNEAMEAAGKLSIKMIFPVAVFMLLPFILVLMYPAGVALLQAFAG